ncbi:MAG: hypothetical protein ACP5O3_00665 [Candidatus Micrarchaeia archaeon]|jgi:hypothetical protein
MGEEVAGMTPEEAYLEGRLIGLSELVSILSDAMKDEGATQGALVKSIVTHISSEMNAILEEMKEQHAGHPVLKEAAAAVKSMASEAKKVEKEPEKAAPVMKKNVEVAEDLMKNLMALKEKSEEE